MRRATLSQGMTRLAGRIVLPAVVVLAALAMAMPHALAQGQPPAFKQVKLTEKAIEGYLASQKDMQEVLDKLPPPGGPDEKPDPKVLAELAGIAKKFGFASYDEFTDIAENINFIMSGFDQQTKAFTEPAAVLKGEIEQVKADKNIPAKDKSQMLKEMEAALKATPPVQFKENIELVKKYYDKIDAASR